MHNIVSLPGPYSPKQGGGDPFITKGVNVSFFRCDVTFLTLIFRVYFVTSHPTLKISCVLFCDVIQTRAYFLCLFCDVTFRCFFFVFFTVYCVTSLSGVSFPCFLVRRHFRVFLFHVFYRMMRRHFSAQVFVTLTLKFSVYLCTGWLKSNVHPR